VKITLIIDKVILLVFVVALVAADVSGYLPIPLD
jgi:hypothetical protein